MSTSIVANRIYHRAKIVAEDIQSIGTDDVLLRAIKPPRQSAGGLLVPDSVSEDHPARACVAFEVVKLPEEMTRGNPLNIKPGDVVLCRNAVVDPLFGNELALTNLYMGVIGVLERA